MDVLKEATRRDGRRRRRNARRRRREQFRSLRALHVRPDRSEGVWPLRPLPDTRRVVERRDRIR